MQPHKLLQLSRPLVLGAALCCLLIWAPAAAAAGCENEFTNGDANGSWIDAGNWEHGVPGEAEDVCIPSGIAKVTIPLAAQAKAKSIVAQSPLTITSTATLAIKNSSAALSNELTSLDLEGTLHTEGSSLKLSGSNLIHSGSQITAPGAATVTLVDGATLAGSGSIVPAFYAQSGSTVQPGGNEAVGAITFAGAYSLNEGSHLDLDLASDSSFDKLVSGPADSYVFSTVTVHLLGGYVPAVGTSWEFTYGALGILAEASIAPSQFSIHSVPGGAELRLDSALPSGGGGGGGGGGQSGGSGQGSGSSSGGSGSPSGGSVQCVVPKLAKLPLAKAKKALTKAHCKPGKVKYRSSAKVKKGSVIKAAKKPKTALPAGTKVNLTVSGKSKKS